MPNSLLDTDTLSEIMRGVNPAVCRAANHYLTQFGCFQLSLITRFEILRGLKSSGASRRLTDFDAFCAVNEVLPITDEIVVRAADFYAHLRRNAQLISDADLLIAATAQIHGLVLVTSNTAHFSRIPGLSLACWSRP
jgi:tRNA(fMet)-specific endonuclease VapC